MGQGPAGVADRLGALRLTSLAARSFAVGALLSLGVWGVVAYRFSGELARVEARAEAVTGRYTQAQEVLSTLRAAALKAERAQKQSGRHAQEFSLILTSALRRYTPIWDSPSERVVIDRLDRKSTRLNSSHT